MQTNAQLDAFLDLLMQMTPDQREVVLAELQEPLAEIAERETARQRLEELITPENYAEMEEQQVRFMQESADEGEELSGEELEQHEAEDEHMLLTQFPIGLEWQDQALSELRRNCREHIQNALENSAKQRREEE